MHDPLHCQLRRCEVSTEERNAFVRRGNIWLRSPSVFLVCGRPISSQRSGLWQGGLVMAAHSCNTDSAFPISAVNKGNRSRSFSISTAHDLPTCWQRLKGERGESRPVVSWSCPAGWPVTSYSSSQWERQKAMKTTTRCVRYFWEEEAFSLDSKTKWRSVVYPWTWNTENICVLSLIFFLFQRFCNF